MKKKIIAALAAVMAVTALASRPDRIVRVDDGRFMRGDSVYNVVGTNFWYGAILGSTGRGGDRARLARELDLMQSVGINNLRVLVGADGDEGLEAHIMPVLQSAPGVYNDTILDGLDYFMAELEKRDMTAVLYLNNSWEWSGGYGSFLQWATGERQPIPSVDGYNTYVDAMSKYVKNPEALRMTADKTRFIVGRTNRYTGRPYSESPALFAWQICNEPRAFASDSVTMTAFKRWIADEAALIKSIDPAHMVSTGSEGKYGCQVKLDAWTEIHSDPNIDYALIHIWPANWGWVNTETLVSEIDSACDYSRDYILEHVEAIKPVGKPILIEEFGYPRDGRKYSVGTPVTARDRYYRYIFDMVERTPGIEGSNFWPWGGYVTPVHETWQPWDPYTGDPAQEPQGLYSVFANDTTTLSIIRSHARRLPAAKALERALKQ